MYMYIPIHVRALLSGNLILLVILICFVTSLLVVIGAIIHVSSCTSFVPKYTFATHMSLKFTFDFSGETGAGKSSFLNLLFGEDILPVHHNPCTSVITKISYGPKRQASILHMDGTTEDIEDIHKGEMKDKLWSKIYETDLDCREKRSRVSEIRLSLPMEILKVGTDFPSRIN